MLQKLRNLSGMDARPVSHTERILSLAGAFAGILVVMLAARYQAGEHGNLLIIASMGASAVLLFAVPHSTFSQPWPLIGGQILSALIGITCSKLIHAPILSPALAVALAVGAMHYLRCIHPPGGATAFAAAFGSSKLHTLDYTFILNPVLFNVLAIFLVAVIFNWFFPWRRYPAAFAKHDSREHVPITHEDFVFAMSRIDSLLDISEQDLMRIYELVTKLHSTAQSNSEDEPEPDPKATEKTEKR